MSRVSRDCVMQSRKMQGGGGGGEKLLPFISKHHFLRLIGRPYLQC